MTTHDINAFTELVWSHYDQSKRDMPWRSNTDPYWILVSEIMLQQTQAARVIPKFEQFIAAFPTIKSLARASLGQVLAQWSGLGYNRRAKFLWLTAQEICQAYDGKVPEERAALESLPGIGPNTAGAIVAYAFNQPISYIETNIRSVYLHHFFPGEHDVDDKELLPIIEKTMQKDHVREWYWALMDYGIFLKKQHANPSRASKHHTKQTRFEGSSRQIRGMVLRLLLVRPMSLNQLDEKIQDERLANIVADLQKEGLVVEDSEIIRLA